VQRGKSEFLGYKRKKGRCFARSVEGGKNYAVAQEQAFLPRGEECSDLPPGLGKKRLSYGCT